ncbi:DinB superfamily protein [Kordia sp. SMS9]|uniref:DinB family protein n=1 Tax=Kordia sp. SMS9 TaxID=2282170 RepID=UPI000E0D6F10|nr:DinB family protein [Kordia sp. SMS9]AXG69733.1 DinB superfamily protein [Kordia sp. SMS9]
MTFNLSKSIEILRQTPETLMTMLSSLSDDWLHNNEGEATWSPHAIVGHLIHGEQTDWIVRAKIILSEGNDKTFEPFDRFAQERDSKGKTIHDLLEKFKALRSQNLNELEKLQIMEGDFSKKGVHPDLGEVTLQQLLATWTVHDLGHIAQIARVMAKQYSDEVGPWSAYLGILKK